jgi:hypothetical protein
LEIPASFGVPGPGEITTAVGFDLADGDLVIAFYPQLRPQLAKILDEIVGERIVVIDDEEHVNLIKPSS